MVKNEIVVPRRGVAANAKRKNHARVLPQPAGDGQDEQDRKGAAHKGMDQKDKLACSLRVKRAGTHEAKQKGTNGKAGRGGPAVRKLQHPGLLQYVVFGKYGKFTGALHCWSKGGPG